MIEIKVNDKEVSKLFNELVKRGQNMSPAMKIISGIMFDAVKENFEKEGPGWEKLKPATIRQREKKGYWPGKILRVRGQLSASITNKYDSKSARVGTNKVYAAIHQFGGDIQRSGQVLHFKKHEKGKYAGKTLFARSSKASFGMKASAHSIHIPPRPFLKMNNYALNAIKSALMNFVISK
ncbi:MAG TPA: phage virion morphogenesis protein [Syntrophorhabdaceae bacterium]|jgi:phage virion morphogenesis protein|nr:phage virion morphogenesis protein [Syntrophorhabdaceae bacterium]